VVDAKNLKDAKEKILLISSQFQTITREGFDEFAADLEDSWLKDTTHFDALDGFDMADPTGTTGLTDEESVPELPVVPTSVLGDIYLLGDHRIMCGDSTDKESVLKLLGGGVPSLMVTDPPYGVEYDPNWRNEAERKNGEAFGGRAIGKVLNDDRADWREAWELYPGNVAYVWHSALHSSEVDASLVAAGFEIRSQIIWAKHRFAISRGHYHWQHEPCWYAVRKNESGNWSGDRSQTTLWAITHNASDTGHGTQKPIECMLRPIENNSKSGDIVYDPFLGSGTTLIAAEKSGRTCYGMELSPQYVDVIVKRWEDFTGRKAEKWIP
jgi:DNA modification methylase